MKVVCCKSCGAKYQLDDNDDVSTFECTSCAGDLELCDDYSSDLESDDSNIPTAPSYESSYIVQCEDCGLKYNIGVDENILDYECESCGGSLRYLDSELNKELDQILEDRKTQQIKNTIESNQSVPVSEEVQESKSTEFATKQNIRSLPSKLGDFFSEEHLHKVAEEEEETSLKQETPVSTARTTISPAVLSKFEKEFSVPTIDDYNVLKDYLKEEFFKGVMKYYLTDEELADGSFDKFMNEMSINEPLPEIKTLSTKMSELDRNNVVLVVGAILFIAGIIEVFLVNSGLGIVALFIGVIILCYGIYKTKDDVETEKRSRVIREHILTLPEEYYVFYNVRIPKAQSGINHLIVGPSGIYAIISQKYNSKTTLNSDNENNNLIGSMDDNKIEEVVNKRGLKLFRYTTKQTEFPKDNAVKQKALKLGELLINFLSLNGIKNCFVEPLVGFVNNEVVVINTPLTDEDLFIDELLHKIKYGTIKLDPETIDKCAVLMSKYSADCSTEF